MRYRLKILVLVATLAVSVPAFAQTPAPPPRSSTWGIVVITTSLLAGAALTSYGLTINCGQDEHRCHRRAALPIWGGLGLAASGTLLGLRLLPQATASGVAGLSLGGSF